VIGDRPYGLRKSGYRSVEGRYHHRSRMKSLRSIPALGAFFVVIALAVSACGSSIPSNSVAVVAGNPISTQAFDHWMYVLAKTQAAQSPGQPVIVPNDPPNFTKCIAQVKAEIPSLAKTATKTLKADCQRVFTSLSSTVLDYLIKAYWYQATAHKLGIKLSTAQVQKALAQAKKGQFSTDAQFQSFLKSTGQTLDDVTYRIKIEQLYTKLLARHPTKVTTAQIQNYYNSHKSQFGTPETRDMKIVLAKTSAQANAAKTALEHGQSWTVVAKKYSIDPTTKDKGGVLTNVTKGQQDAALSNAAFAAKTNKLIGPVKGQFGYYVVEVTKITPATQKTLAQSSATIKQTLQNQAQTTAANAVVSESKKDWQSKTKCRQTYAMADCAGYKAPKTSTTSGAAPAPSGTAPASTTPAP
jgi:foldase protein PrsA